MLIQFSGYLTKFSCFEKNFMLRKISYVLLLSAFAVCLWLWFEHTSFWQESLRESEENCRLSGICFAAHGQHTYGFLSERYFYIAVFLVFFLFGNFIKHKPLSLAVCLAALVLTGYQFWQIYGWYSQLINQFADYATEPFFALLRGSVPYLRICGGVIFLLIALQVLIFFRLPSQNEH